MAKSFTIVFLVFCFGCLLLVQLLSADDRGIIAREHPATTPQADQRVALVIGNGAYESSPLRNPVNDARAIAAALRELEFDVTARENLTQKEMKRDIQSFGQKLVKGGIGLFFYAGHGMQVNGRNYLIPVGASIEHEKQVEYEAVDLGYLLSEMDFARNPLNIVILDACRDNPLARGFRSGVQGLASINAPAGTLIAFATAPGSVAGDGPGENGVYTAELIRTMQTPGLKIEEVFKQVRAAVQQKTQGKQVPWESSSLVGDFYFRPAAPGSGATASADSSQGVTGQPSRGSEIAPSRSVKIWKEPVTGMEFVWIEAGCYQMGSPETQVGRETDEGPLHEVCVDGFWMGKTEVTNGQFRKYDGRHESKDYKGVSLNGDHQPVVYVSWEEAKSLAAWLQKQNGGQWEFRLPTEAEWEYVCRAGAATSRYWGDDPDRACSYENVADQTSRRLWGWDVIHNCDDGYAATSPVGSFQANRWGLHDLLGNAAEWCEDIYRADAYQSDQRYNPMHRGGDSVAHRVFRGGHWHGRPEVVRCSIRGSGLPAGQDDNLGFRLVRKP
jgi:formylglycine-generating enzyme required for sulfatase activity